MDFKKHSDLSGKHAFLSPSNYHWVNYDEEKLIRTYSKWQATEKGTRLHALAHDLISLGVRLPENNHTLNLYVNDAIGFKMIPEQVLYFSDNCFGTADAISFRRKTLRIHDLKTGESRASIHQLEVYAAIFCLEYGYKPHRIKIELRIYQSNNVIVANPSADDIQAIMDKIVMFDKKIENLRSE